MMISLGYYFDQVSRERMTQRIAERTKLIAASTPIDTPVGRGDVLWIEPAHPVYHQLEIAWKVDDVAIPNASNLPVPVAGVAKLLPTATDGLRQRGRSDAVRARSRDSRDGADGDAHVDAQASAIPQRLLLLRPMPRLAGSTPTTRPVGGTDVIYIELSPDRSTPLRE